MNGRLGSLSKYSTAASGALHRLRHQVSASQRRPGGHRFGAKSTKCSSYGSRCLGRSPAQQLSRSPTESLVCQATGGGGKPPSGGNGGKGSGGGGSSGEGLPGDGDDEEELLSLAEAEALAAGAKVRLPQDFVAEAAAGGLRKSALLAYLALQDHWFTAWISRFAPLVRDRLLFDHRFLFIVVSEMAIDSVCATVAEVRKRGDDFWGEFEFYFSDLIVGLILDVALVTLMAPRATIGALPRSRTATGLSKFLARTPSAIFQANPAGEAPYGLGNRVACLGVKALEYSLAGLVCGLAGQGVANTLMNVKRKFGDSGEHDVDLPPVVMTGLVWGLFMGGSSNLRYQTVFGLERIVDLTIAKRIPKFAYFSSFVLRFANNVIGGENFIDHARWAGVQ